MIAVAAVALLASIPFARAAESEEQRLIRIAKNLKPISDSQWNEIAGAKSSETYDIQKGDTLWDLSKRLFGNAYYWPKVWSLNAGITNPHFVSPGQKLVFIPGSSEAAPKLAPAPEAASGASSPAKPVALHVLTPPSGPHEYDKVPPDRWAPPDFSQKNALKNYDEYGLDKDLKVEIPSRFTLRVPAIANDTTVPFLGEIVGSRRDGVGLSQHDTVFLKSSSQDLQVGTSYSILSEPEFVREKKSDRSGYVYRALGEVRIVGVKDELYVGLVEKAYDVIERGDRAYPLLPLVTGIKPLPARNALEALVLLTGVASTQNSSQFRVVHFDRGIEDGVQVGNVFRVYDYYDPVTRAKLTDSDFLANADALIVHATAQFSTALVIRSRDTFARGDFGVLLTDVSDLEPRARDRAHGLGENAPKQPEDKELDELDELDRASGEGLGKKEETEIKELDQWDKTKDFQNQPNAEPTMPSAADTPTDEAEKAPGKPAEPKPEAGTPYVPGEPTLDKALDAPGAAPKGEQPPAPPAHLAPGPESPQEAPPAPLTPETKPEAGQPMPGLEPLRAAPGEPTPNVEPVQAAPPDDLEIKK